jgi:hypothetical protein
MELGSLSLFQQIYLTACVLRFALSADILFIIDKTWWSWVKLDSYSQGPDFGHGHMCTVICPVDWNLSFTKDKGKVLGCM